MADDELRLARFKLKQANKTIGRQGQTIHALRAELAETRELHSKIERGEIRSLERSVTNLVAQLDRVCKENQKLHDERRELEAEG
jgi:septal ring factor EnvC (AmiA/AmiB activator)